MRILIVSDAWEPQVNGVVRTLQAMRRELTDIGHEVGFITPDQYRSLPCPTYPEIRLAMAWPSSVRMRTTGVNAGSARSRMTRLAIALV